MFNLDYSYLSLPKKLYSKTKPYINDLSEVFISNHKLYNDLNIIDNGQKIVEELLKKKYYKKSFAQAYAGHQFGHFTKLGDGRAIILGENSYGKGSVQSIIPLRNGGGIRLTISKYYLPSGKSISEVGVTPDIFIEEEGEDYTINTEKDNQLNYAIKLFSS